MPPPSTEAYLPLAEPKSRQPDHVRSAVNICLFVVPSYRLSAVAVGYGIKRLSAFVPAARD